MSTSLGRQCLMGFAGAAMLIASLIFNNLQKDLETDIPSVPAAIVAETGTGAGSSETPARLVQFDPESTGAVEAARLES